MGNCYRKIYIFFLCLITVATFIPSFSNQFTNWDDQQHLLSNPCIRALDAAHSISHFTNTVLSTYIPLTTLSYAIEYHFFGLQPLIYHLDNFILHLLVVLLIFYFCLRVGLSETAAFIASLLFAIHPMQRSTKKTK